MSQKKDETWHKGESWQNPRGRYADLLIDDERQFTGLESVIDCIIADHEAASRVRKLEAALEMTLKVPEVAALLMEHGKNAGDYREDCKRCQWVEALARLRTNEAQS